MSVAAPVLRPHEDFCFSWHTRLTESASPCVYYTCTNISLRVSSFPSFMSLLATTSPNKIKCHHVEARTSLRRGVLKTKNAVCVGRSCTCGVDGTMLNCCPGTQAHRAFPRQLRSKPALAQEGFTPAITTRAHS